MTFSGTIYDHDFQTSFYMGEDYIEVEGTCTIEFQDSIGSVTGNTYWTPERALNAIVDRAVKNGQPVDLTELPDPIEEYIDVSDIGEPESPESW